MSSEHGRHFKFPPRHEFKSLEETGIKTDFPFGRTIITASFSSHKDPHNENPQIDFSARKNAVWLTYEKEVNGQKYDFVIGPNGEPSSIAIHWNNGVPEIFMEVEGEMQKIEELNRDERAIFINTPENASTFFVYKRYPKQNLREFYGIMRLPENTDFLYPATFQPYIAKETLVSGMRNRGLSVFPASFWAVRITDKSELPFGRELSRKR